MPRASEELVKENSRTAADELAMDRGAYFELIDKDGKRISVGSRRDMQEALKAGQGVKVIPIRVGPVPIAKQKG